MSNRCQACGGLVRGPFDDDPCRCVAAGPLADPQTGLSLRFIRQYDFEAANGLGDADENDAKPPAAWTLTTNDRRFLRSLRIGVE